MALFRSQATMTQHMTIGSLFLPLFLPAALAIAGPLQAQQWRTASEKDGIRLESRQLPGERFDELRVSASLKASPQTVAVSCLVATNIPVRVVPLSPAPHD